MSPTVLLGGFLMALLAWCLHVAWWRIRRPRDDLKALAWCLFLVPSLASLGLCWTEILTGVPMLMSLLLAESLGIAYLFWYPAAQAVSPTMLISILAGRAGDKGVSRESLRDSIPEETLTADTVDNLFHEKFARLDVDGHVQLDERGRRTLVIIRHLRHSAGFSEPKG